MNKYELMVLIQFCQDYHSGQFSRLYRLQCLLMRKLNRRDGSLHRLFLRRDSHSIGNLRAHVLYHKLLTNYGNDQK